jgi:predicted nucleotidyltransferase component of viral defense system
VCLKALNERLSVLLALRKTYSVRASPPHTYRELLGRGTVRKIPGRFQDQHALEGKLNVHSVEEICPEKLRSLLQRREPRDLYDIWRLLGDTPTLDREQIGILFREKCEFREIDPIPLAEVLGPNAPSLENLWTARLSQQIAELPHFDRVVRETRRLLRTFAD